MFFWTIHHSLILRKSNESFDNQLFQSLITEDNSLLEISNVNSSTKGRPLTAVKAGTDMLYLHPGWKPLTKGKVFSGFLYVVSAMDGLDFPTADVCFRLLWCAIVIPFLFSLASGAQEIFYLTEGNFVHPPRVLLARNKWTICMNLNGNWSQIQIQGNAPP